MGIIHKIANLNWSKLGLFLMFALILLPSNSKAIVIALFGLMTFSLSVKRKLVFDFKLVVINSLIFVSIGVTMLYSDNTDYAIRKIQQLSSLLIFPFIFALTTQEERQAFFKNISLYLWTYLTAVFLFNVIAFLWFYSSRSFEGMIEHFTTLLTLKSGKYNIHPIYLSMHCGVAILFSFYLLRNLRNKYKILAVVLMDITLVLFLLLYAKKGPLLALVVVFTLFVLFQRKKSFVKPYLLAVIGLVFFTIAIPRTRNKFVELLKIEMLDKGNITSTNIRYTIYQTAQELIAENPFLGYGIGDYNDTLVDRYTKNGDELLVSKKYNAHNQYFSFLLMGGILTLIVFLLTLGFNLIYAIRFDNQILILLLLFYGIVMFTENILEREQGVIFFSFFLNFFTLRSLFKREEV